jgi:hypothetical protein
MAPPKPGDWIETTAQYDDTLQGQTEEILVLKKHPPAAAVRHCSHVHPTARRQQGPPNTVDAAAAACPFPSSPFLLKAFTPAYPGEPASSIEARMSIMDSTWDKLESRLKVRIGGCVCVCVLCRLMVKNSCASVQNCKQWD